MNTFFEKYLSKIPMYAVVGGTLTLLITSALAVSFFNGLSFSPLALVASAAVFVGAGVGASWLLGKLYGVPSHINSAAITALILTLLFTPTLDPAVLLQYAFIAVLAQASKYVLTFRGRHIFNPAAVATFIGGAVLQLQFASWWVGTPVLFVPLLITAFLVLYKTRQLALGGLFVAIAVALVTLGGALRGENFIEAAIVALTSWPILFAAGFMLSEPLTLPPRKWQKLTVAAVAAIIVGLPFHVGGFYSSPEFAIVIGNIVAFGLAFSHRRRMQLTLKKKVALTPTSYEFTFATDHPVAFEPGQYLELSLPHAKQDLRGTRRSFSITSLPNERHIKLGIKFYEPGSTFKKKLLSLEPGATLHSTGITGDFVLPASPNEKLLFIAGGIGITPFISHVLAGASQGEQRDITLLYFVRNPQEAAYKEVLDASGINVHYFVAKNATPGFTMAPYLTAEVLEKYAPDSSSRIAYVSGPAPMVAATKKLLKHKVKRLHTDYFSGY